MLHRIQTRRFKKTAAAIALASITAPAFSASNEELDQRIRILERQLENQQEVADTKAKESAKITADSKGFSIKSANGEYELSFRGLVQADARVYTGEQTSGFTDALLLRRVEPSLQGTLFKYVGFVITPQFGGTSPSLLDYYVDLRFDPAATVRIGRFKEPIGLENLQSSPAITFIERGLPTDLVPSRELGLQLQGEILDGTLKYAAGIFNGAADGGDGAALTEADNRHDYAVRIFAEPFRNSPGFFQGLGFGIAASKGATLGSVANTANNVLIAGGTGKYVSSGQLGIFGYRATAGNVTNAAGDRNHLSPQAYWYYNNYGLLTEYVISEAEVVNGSNHDNLRHTAHQFAFNYVITGEDASFKGVKPASPFVLGGDGWGALEVAARTGGINFDSDSFVGTTATNSFAIATESVTRAREYGLALNWYLNSNLKLAANYEYTTFSGGKTGGADRDDERAFLARVQIAY